VTVVGNKHYDQVKNVLWIVLILNWLVAGSNIVDVMVHMEPVPEEQS
jgi:hypothetical protein